MASCGASGLVPFSDDCLLVCLDGRTVQTVDQYLREIGTILHFPDSRGGIDGYLDWIRDLSWPGLEWERIVLVITHYEAFMKDRPEDKEKIISLFSDCILPFWEEEVLHCVVEGRSKQFNVILLNDDDGRGRGETSVPRERGSHIE